MRIESIILADIDSRQNPETGDREKTVKKGQKLSAATDFTGIQTQQLGQTQGFNLSKTIELLRVIYKNEKYLLLGSEAYEVKNISKGKTPAYLKLHCQSLNDAEIKKAMEDWKNANL